jgi:integrase
MATSDPRPRSRRSHGDGGLYFDEHKRLWVGALDLGRDGTGARQRIKITGRTKAEARTKLSEARRKVEDGLPLGDNRTTVGQFLDDWLKNGLPSSAKSANTIDNYRWAVHNHIKPALGAKRLRDLSPEDIDRMLAAKAGSGMSRSSMARIHGILQRALRHAERRGRVGRNVATLVDVPNGPSSPSRSLTVEQAQKLLESARGDRLEALYITGLMLGLRPGELLGLPWTALDLDNAVLRVTQALKRERGDIGQVLVVGEPKTARSRRTLDMPTPVVGALRAHKVRQATERLAAGHSWVDNGLVFTTEIGTPIDPANLRRGFSRLTIRAGLGHWHPHELRHSAASILSAAGVPIEVVADVLGHDGPRTTAAVYRHLISPSIAAAKGPMDAAFGTVDRS